MPKVIKDYSDDDSTHTLSIITDVTECNCIVSHREFTYMDDDDETMEIKQGTEITLETLCDSDDRVYCSLEELQEQE